MATPSFTSSKSVPQEAHRSKPASPQVSQRTLEMLAILQREYREVRTALLASRKEIGREMKSGATVEAGMFKLVGGYRRPQVQLLPQVRTERSLVPWPKSVKIPSTLAAALDDGWKVDGEEDQRGTEYLERGVKVMTKKVGQFDLFIAVPFRARYNHGKPRAHMARRMEAMTAAA